MPLGRQLLHQIAGRFREMARSGFDSRADHHLLRTLQMLGFDDVNSKIRLFDHMAQAMEDAPSIDNYIFTRTDNPEIVASCKIAIAQELLRAERESALYFEGKSYSDPTKIRQSWYPKFFSLLNERVDRTNVGNIFNNVEIINFNYDRSLKHYLYNNIKRYYEISDDFTRSIMQTLSMSHPYGNLGSLEWESVPSGVSLRGYGFDNGDLSETISSIRTFTESVSDEDGILSKIGSSIGSADKLIFLGFAFHEQNTDLLAKAPATSRKAAKAFGSAHGLSARSKQLYEKTIKSKFECQSVDLDYAKCTEFFDEFHGLLNS